VETPLDSVVRAPNRRVHGGGDAYDHAGDHANSGHEEAEPSNTARTRQVSLGPDYHRPPHFGA
jgi:hypothetical protein